MTRTMALVRPAFTAVSRSPRAWLALGAWAGVALACALFARHGHWMHGADVILLNVVGSLVVPLLAYAVVGAILQGGPMARLARPLMGLGASAEAASVAPTLVAVVVSAGVAGVLGAVVAFLAHGIGDPPVTRDAAVSAYAAALGGASYASWFGLGATFGKRGGGRWVLLLADWIVGSGDGTPAALSPRAHLRNMLGGAPPLRAPQGASAAFLFGSVAMGLALVAWRARTQRLNA